MRVHVKPFSLRLPTLGQSGRVKRQTSSEFFRVNIRRSSDGVPVMLKQIIEVELNSVEETRATDKVCKSADDPATS